MSTVFPPAGVAESFLRRSLSDGAHRGCADATLGERPPGRKGVETVGALIVAVLLFVVAFGLTRAGRAQVRRPGGEPRAIPLRPLALLSSVLGLVVLGLSLVVTVGATEVGIPVTFGRIGTSLSPGVHLKAPWTSVTTFSTRLQESNLTATANEGDRATADGVEVLSSEGGRLIVDVTVRYTVDRDQAPGLFRQVGTMDAIRERLVRPDVRSIMRDIYATRTAEEAYSTERVETAAEVEASLAERLEPRGINIDSVAVRDIVLDERLQAALNQKLEATAAAERALINQDTIRNEAETARIAAQGRADANAIEEASITPELLRAREIDAIAANDGVVFYPYGQPVTIVQGVPADAGGAAPPSGEP